MAITHHIIELVRESALPYIFVSREKFEALIKLFYDICDIFDLCEFLLITTSSIIDTDNFELNYRTTDIDTTLSHTNSSANIPNIANQTKAILSQPLPAPQSRNMKNVVFPYFASFLISQFQRFEQMFIVTDKFQPFCELMKKMEMNWSKFLVEKEGIKNYVNKTLVELNPRLANFQPKPKVII